MECANIRALLNEYADGELNSANTEAVAVHLPTCPACMQAFDKLDAIRNAVKAQARYFAAPATLGESIMANLPAHTTPKKWLGAWQWPQIAASFALAVVITTSVAKHRIDSIATDRLTQEVVSSHVRSLMVSHLSDVASSDQHTVKPWFNGKLDFAPPVTDLTEMGYPLIGGRLDYINNRAVAALVYRHRQHLINVFIWPTGNISNSSVSDVTQQGYNLVHWSHEGMTFWVVSDIRATDLNELAQLLQTRPHT